MNEQIGDPPPRLELAGVDDNSTATAQEAVPLPHFAGQRAGVLRWISPIYNQRAVEAPQARPAKK
jgi:hypothetical protein